MNRSSGIGAEVGAAGRLRRGARASAMERA
jgi:hypothetical protein